MGCLCGKAATGDESAIPRDAYNSEARKVKKYLIAAGMQTFMLSIRSYTGVWDQKMEDIRSLLPSTVKIGPGSVALPYCGDLDELCEAITERIQDDNALGNPTIAHFYRLAYYMCKVCGAGSPLLRGKAEPFMTAWGVVNDSFMRVAEYFTPKYVEEMNSLTVDCACIEGDISPGLRERFERALSDLPEQLYGGNLNWK
mmetsp:Transcript_29058/g.77905  ORF Transcript_29058/g.77905 Transcript_29058/m.77905 type:complete len:199 (-) Transcript_29058:499-1095(-)